MIKKRLISLDYIKLFSAAIIVFHHYQQETGAVFNGINFYGGVFLFGYIVELFFIVSGFLTANNVEKTEKQDFKNFIIRKIIRFIPMYWLSLVVIAILDIVNIIVFGEMLNSPDGIGIWKTVNNLFLSFRGGLVYYEKSLGYNNPVWYICVLILCYSIFYFFVWLSKKKNQNYTYFFFFISVFAYWCYKHDFVVPLTDSYAYRGYCSFFLGTVLHCIYTNVLKNQKLSKHIFVFSIIALIGIGIIAKFKYSFFFDDSYSIMLFVIYPIIIFSGLYLDTNIVTKELKINSSLSFEVLIWHEVLLLVLLTLDKFIPSFLSNYNSYLLMFVFTVIVFLFSWFMCKVENIINNIVHKKIKKLEIIED